MRITSVAGLLALAGAGIASYVLRREAPADPRRDVPPPAVVLLEGLPGETSTAVVLRSPGSSTQPVTLGVVAHLAFSALRGSVDPSSPSSAPRVFVVAAESASHGASTYHSALWRVQSRGASRLLGGLTDASRPLLTERGSLVVQRGRDGTDPVALDRALHERSDALQLDVVDPRNGSARTVWTGEGMIAYLASTLGGDEVLVYHCAPTGSTLFALDVATRARRTLLARLETPARDFSYDARRAEVTFARASAREPGQWEVVTISARHETLAPGAVQVRWRAANEHLMPRVLRDSNIVFSLPGDRGAAMLGEWPQVPTREAPLGDGADEALAESADGAWIAFRHRTPTRELLSLYERATKRAVSVDRSALYVELAGFVGGTRP